MDLMSARGAAERWNISQRRVAVLCSEGRILGAKRVGNMWVMPADVQKPDDGRSQRLSKSRPTTVKPFVKWAGGKGQLLDDIRNLYPGDLGKTIVKYAEPFVGGGAVLFDILSTFKLEELYISDINAELINAYEVIRDASDEIICLLEQYQSLYVPADAEGRKSFYYCMRDKYNELKQNGGSTNSVESAAIFIFLNKTCFNGLYRVNRKGLFNVPMGAYRTPGICDGDNIRRISAALKKVTIVCGDYRKSEAFIDDRTFVYFDPPYRPLTETAGFTAYTESLFDDAAQMELANFVNRVSVKGAKVLVSNSDPKNADVNDNFFDNLYSGSRIERVGATRMINCKSEARGKVKELLIANY